MLIEGTEYDIEQMIADLGVDLLKLSEYQKFLLKHAKKLVKL